MKKVKVVLNNKLGLHARASAKFVSLASRFQSHLDVTSSQKRINGKSIMGVMMLAAINGSELLLEVDGPDEDAMIDALVTLINNRFDESE
jgi:phosphocarrier protein HPr